MKLQSCVKKFYIFLTLIASVAQADEFYRVDKYDYGHDLLDPNQVTFVTRDSGRRLGDLAGLCKSLVLISMQDGQEKVLDNCVGGSDYALEELKKYYLRGLAQARSEGKKVLFRTSKAWGFDKYDLKILEASGRNRSEGD